MTTSTTKTATTGDNAIGHKHSQAMLQEVAKHALDWLEESFSISEQPTGLVEELSDALSYAEQHGINTEYDAGLRDDTKELRSLAKSIAFGPYALTPDQWASEARQALELSDSDQTAQSDTGQSSRKWAAREFDDDLEGYPLLSPEGLAAIATDPEYQKWILICVNAHESLIAALEQAQTEIRQLRFQVFGNNIPGTTQAQIDEALRQARGEE
jgi:hypothetical protein